MEDHYTRRNLQGLEAFFHESAAAAEPPRWKMALLTWLGVWPTVYFVSALGAQGILSHWPAWLAVGVDALVVVIVLTWAVMPALARMARSWLKKP